MERNKNFSIPLVMIKGAIFSCILTAIVVAVLSVLVWKAGMTEKILHITVIIFYALICFASGNYCGRKINNRRFLWGLAAGLVYFLILSVISWLLGNDKTNHSMITGALVCMGGGMFGGMMAKAHK